MKKRIWHRIQRIGLAAMIAGSVLISGSVQAQTVNEENPISVDFGYEENVQGQEAESAQEECMDIPLQEGTGDFLENEGVLGDSVEIQEEIAEGDTGEQEEPTEGDAEDRGEIMEGDDEDQEESTEGDVEDQGETEDEEPEKLPELSEPTEKASFMLTVEAVPDTAAAGRKLLYEVQVENTGNLPFKSIRFTEILEEDWSVIWEKESGEEMTEPVLGWLEPGEKRICYLGIPVPEDWTKSVKLELSAEGKAVVEEVSEETLSVIRQTEILTEITPLKVDFQVTKTADRTVAVPGDRVLFRICIRNTGERTLHSVVTTEKFQLEKVTAVFLEQDGVILNNTKTKALIRRLDPGRSISLQAVVVLPEKLTEKKLINEVEVVSKETGERVITSQAELQIQAEEQQEERLEPDNCLRETDICNTGQSRPISANPKTGDVSDCQSMKENAGLALLMMGVLSAVRIKRKRCGTEE